MHFDFVDLGLLLHSTDTCNLARAAQRSHLAAPAGSNRIMHAEHLQVLPSGDFSQLLGAHFVSLLTSSAIHAFVISTADALGARLELRIQVGDFEAACRMIEAGVAIYIVAESVALRHRKTMQIAPVGFERSLGSSQVQVLRAEREGPAAVRSRAGRPVDG
ncbi:LysR substrate-binding domain-containing protein [Paraburkholderia sp.]|jgi:DNA-binding transcriptional LysR family regulator|uniref:LysR substrate-binding domain-containing protein n=1 Tax=Paraburkholderia sp. TaxID=1926495 RepID=UPI002F3FE4BB